MSVHLPVVGVDPLAAVVLGATLVVGAAAVIPRRPMRIVLWLCLVVALTTIGWLTLALEFGDAGGTGLNLTPFQEIRRGLSGQRALGYVNVVGNVLLFVPVGALVAWIARRWRVVIATLAGAAFSAGIELTQLSLGRVVDIDDIILNTAGALLGAVLAVAFVGVVRALRPTPATDR